MNKINKNDLVKTLSNNLKRDEKEISLIVNELFQEMTHQINQGECVQILGFGSFEKYKRKKRNATNPRTGEKMEIPEKESIRFKRGSLLSL